MVSEVERLNFVMNLPRPVFKRAVGLSTEITKRYDAYFRLWDFDKVPHITVYSAVYDIECIGDVLRAARNIIPAEPIQIKTTGVESHQGYIGVKVECTNAIREFHQHALATLSPLCSESRNEEGIARFDYTPKQLANIRMYGCADVLELYKPHFTLTRLKNEEEAKEAAQKITWDIQEFKVQMFSMYTSGDHGTCKTRLRSWGRDAP